MKIIGNVNNPPIMLIYGAGFYWQNYFAGIIKSLVDDYCLIIPELAGHGDKNTKGMGTVEREAKVVVEELLEINMRQFKVI